MKRMQHQDPHLRSLTSIDILKTYEEQLKKRLQQDLPNIKHSSAHMLSRERQE